MHAPIALALVAGLVVGALAQKTRLCMVGGIRDAVLFRDFHLLLGLYRHLGGGPGGQPSVTGNFTLSFTGAAGGPHRRPVERRLAWSWWALAQRAAGRLPAAPADPGGQRQQRQRRHRAGHVGGRRLSATTSAWPLRPSGPTANGKIAVILGLVVVAAIALLNIQKQRKTGKN